MSATSCPATPTKRQLELSEGAKICAVVVLFHPDAHWAQRAQSILNSVAALIVVDNTPEADISGSFSQTNLCYLPLRQNRGIGFAQNIGIRAALDAGAEYVLLLDQDSEIAPEMVQQLHAAHQSLHAEGIPVAAVGPYFYDQNTQSPMLITRPHAGKIVFETCPQDTPYVETDTLIASGMLISRTALFDLGLMSEALFIDFVDHDWCLWAKHLGYRCFVVTAARMSHFLGKGAVKTFKGSKFTTHSPLRFFYQTRNALWLARQPWLESGWRRKLLYVFLIVRPVMAFLSYRQKVGIVGAYLHGVFAGITKRHPLPQRISIAEPHVSPTLVERALAMQPQSLRTWIQQQRQAAFLWLRTYRRISMDIPKGRFLRMCIRYFLRWPIQANPATTLEYAGWIQEAEPLGKISTEQAEQMLAALPAHPRVSVLLLATTDSRAVLRSVRALLAQSYPHWELLIALDSKASEKLRRQLTAYAQQDARIHWLETPLEENICARGNRLLAQASGPWITLLGAGDRLAPHALLILAKTITTQPGVQILYSDADQISPRGIRAQPCMNPDWNPDLFLSRNLLAHFGVFALELIHSVGGFRTQCAHEPEYDLALRCVAQTVSATIHHLPHVLYHRQAKGHAPYAGVWSCGTGIASEASISHYLQATHQPATVHGDGTHCSPRRIRYALPQQAPRVSILIPTRDGLALLRQCIDSILARTQYPHYEIIIIDNGSSKPETLAYFEQLKTQNQVRILRDESPFNYSRLNNQAAQIAAGDILCLLNNDTEVISPDWLHELVGQVLRPGIGVVGARLYYANTRIQHAGLLLGIGGVAGHMHIFQPHDAPGYLDRAQLVQNVSALTAACFVVRKEVYLQAGGLDEKNLTVAFNDVEFCIRVRQLGLRNLWTPYAELFHYESATRGSDMAPDKRTRFEREIHYMRWRYAETLDSDPAYNPNLHLYGPLFTLDYNPRLSL